MRLVDDDERHTHAAEEAPEPALEAFRRDVHELVLARRESPHAVAPRLPVERRVDDRGTKAVPFERIHLVLHERDERAHDEDGAGKETRGNLEGERLPGARGHEADAVPAGQDRIDDLLLPRTELLEAEDTREDVSRSGRRAERELFDAPV